MDRTEFTRWIEERLGATGDGTTAARMAERLGSVEAAEALADREWWALAIACSDLEAAR